jgi:RNase P/RNase MRP subunit POP5
MMRPKRRYIAFEIIGTETGKNDVIKALNITFGGNTVLEFNKGLLRLVFYDPVSKFGLLRCGHKQVDAVKTIITQVGFGDTQPSFKVLGVSGTIKAARRKFFAHTQAKVK